jgi:hypothetical protein
MARPVRTKSIKVGVTMTIYAQTSLNEKRQALGHGRFKIMM